MNMSIPKKKLFGKYYTPSVLAEAIAKWVVREPNTHVLDPSFGGCALLNATLRILRSKGVLKPGRFLFGVDIDKKARISAEPLINAGAAEENFITADFHTITPDLFSDAPFDAIVGNPPFVRHHYISHKKLAAAKRAMERASIKISGKSSYWVYFLINSLQFLRCGGRLAMILPISFLSAEYSGPVRQHISKMFRKVNILVLNDKLFDDVEETIVVLLADGYLQRNLICKVNPYAKVQDINSVCLNLRNAGNQVENIGTGNWNLNQELLPLEVFKIFKSMAKDRRVTTLGDWANIRIGVVSGANRFFILRQSEKTNFSLEDEFMQPIVTKSCFLKSTSFTSNDQKIIKKKNYRSSLLIASRNSNLSDNVKRYLKRGEQLGVPKRFKCESRTPWYFIRDTYAPDAFFHYMSVSLPHVTLNFSSSTCTNAIHRLVWKRAITNAEQKAVALASITSLTQLSCEMVGRSYGGGVLKIEPTKASKVLLPVPQPSKEISTNFLKADKLLREGNKSSAIELADECILEGFLDMKSKHIHQIKQAQHSIISYRQKSHCFRPAE